MDEQTFQFGVPEGVNETTLHPLGLAAIIVFGVALLVVPRRYAVWPMIFTACFIAPAQRVALFTLNFTLLRIMVVFAVLRIIVRLEYRGFRWKQIDTVVLAWIVSGTLLNIMLWGTLDAVKNRMGWAYDNLGMYFLFRCVIRDWEDLRRLTWGCVVASVPVAIAFLIENRTGQNLFAFFGGVPSITAMREGKLRCQGAFAHAILAGCFWASVMPLMAALFWQGWRDRIISLIGIMASLVVIIACSSSTPVSALIFGVVAGLMFFLRRHMRAVRWSVVIALGITQLFMAHPIWWLFAKIDFVGGSTGWHRYWLTDLAIRNISDWWILGCTDCARWAPDEPYLDVTNQYILEGIDGGLLTLILFLAVVVISFRTCGQLWRRCEGNTAHTALAWALGVSLFVHCVSFLGVSYFGQIKMLWLLTIAVLGSLAPEQGRLRNPLQRLSVIRRSSPQNRAYQAIRR